MLKFSSIAKKQIMALTGLLLCGFLVAHLAGNCLIYAGAEPFNRYAHTLISNPLIIPAEIVLALIFLTHIGLALCLTRENRKARPHSNVKRKTTGQGATLASSNMLPTGFIILVFLVFHILHFKFGPSYAMVYDGVVMRDLYRLVMEYFQNPWAVLWYVVAMVALGLHLRHGLWSVWQSLGVNHPQYNKFLRLQACALSFILAAGFAALPIYCYFQGGR